MNNYFIGQRVIYSNTICTVCKPEREDLLELECHPQVWIFDPSVGYKRYVSAGNVQLLPNGQL